MTIPQPQVNPPNGEYARPVQLQVVTEQSARTASLPAHFTSFIGRESDLEAACALLRTGTARLVTMTGPGGVGKTSLSIRVAQELEGDYADGVWFVPLASVSGAAQVPGAVAKALAIRESGHRTVEEGLVAFLRTQQTLLVLDNFEHVLGAAPFVAELLTAAPGLQCLVSSRALLRISAEHDFPVLPLPAPDETDPIAEVAESAAVRLFVTRAQALQNDFALTGANAAQIAAICRQVDGLPLAIELAAARIRHFSPATLLARLEGAHGGSPLNVLVGGPLDAPIRQRSLRDTIAWSYSLLEPEEQSLFCALSAFVGGFTLEAAEFVATGDEGGEAEGRKGGGSLPPNRLTASPLVLDGIASLVDKSLIEVHEAPNGETRYRFVETIREFGLEMLRESGDEASVRDAHARFALDLAVRAYDRLFGAEQLEWWTMLEIEHANLRGALDWFARRRADEELIRLANALLFFWWYQGHLVEGLRWLEFALSLTTDDTDPARAWAAVGAAILSLNYGDTSRLGEFAAIAERAAHASNDREAAGVAGMTRAWLALIEHREEDVPALCAQVEADVRASGSYIAFSFSLGDIGLMLAAVGDRARGTALVEEALSEDRLRGNRYIAAVRLSDLGVLAQQAGDELQAAARFAESAHLLADVGGAWYLMNPVAGLAAIAVRTDPRRCARLLGAAEALRARSGQPSWPYERERDERAARAARDALGDDRFTAESQIGRTLMLIELLKEVDAVLAGVAKPEPDAAPEWSALGLSPREAEVLRLVVAGRSDRDIADMLYISPRTASKHVANILAKLNVGTRGEAAVLAVRMKLV